MRWLRDLKPTVFGAWHHPSPPGVSGLEGKQMTLVPHWPLLEWRERWPELKVGITYRGPRKLDGTGPRTAEAFDLRLIGATRPGTVERWLSFREWSGFPAVVHAPQVHGTAVLRHEEASAAWRITDPADGHVTGLEGLMLTVSIADCVPVYLYDPAARVIGLLHAGRKGVAGEILAAGLGEMTELGAAAPRVHVHAGPSICGECYEVGPEVHGELGLPIPTKPEPVDLRKILRRQALALGIPSEQVSAATECTLCSPDAGLFSHRAGHAGRQVAFIGLAPAGSMRRARP